MGKSTYSGPIRSRNGFQIVEKSSSGKVLNWTNVVGSDIRRYTLQEYFTKLPALNAVIATDENSNAAAHLARNLANRDFEVLGTNAVTASSTFDTTRGGISITTTTADEDQVIIVPHLDTNQTAWSAVKWGTENQLIWECSISTNAIDNQKVWAGLKLTNDQLIATDADQAFFLFETDGDNGTSLTDFTKWHFIYSVNGTDYISRLPITVAANTEYHFRIEVDADRKASIFVNGIQYDVSSVSGSTGGTLVGHGTTKSLALKNDVDLIPYIGIENGDAGAEVLDVHYQAISRIVFE